MEGRPSIDEVFRPGSSVWLEFITETGHVKTYTTRIEDLTADRLALSMPTDRGARVRIQPGTELAVNRMDNERQQAYLSYVKVIENKPGNIPLLICARPVEIEIMPRRRYYRVDVQLPFRYSGDDLEGEGMITNMSLSGLFAIVEPDPQLKNKALLNCEIKLPTLSTPIFVMGEITRTQVLPNADKQVIALDFKDITEALRDQINQYLFQRQRELIQIGVLFGQPKE